MILIPEKATMMKYFSYAPSVQVRKVIEACCRGDMLLVSKDGKPLGLIPSHAHEFRNKTFVEIADILEKKNKKGDVL